MSLSIQTNVDSINAQENLRVNQQFQSQTIQRLTSGYRINSSSDDAAGLAVANQYRDDISELTQGVRNANDGISTLQITDGGLSNISTMIDRLKTLATQSASATFSGDRGTLNTEYQTLLGEIDRQANNIGLGTGAIGGRYDKSIDVYIGGGEGIQANAKVTSDLGGSRIDSAGLGILATNILGGGGTDVGSNSLTSGQILKNGASQVFTFRTTSNESGLQVTINGTTAGLSAQDVVAQFNSQLNGTGIAATVDSNGKLEFYGDKTAFAVDVAAASSTTANPIVSTATADAGVNANMATMAGVAVATTGLAAATSSTFSINGTNVTVNFASGDTASDVATKVNSAMSQYGVYAVLDSTGTKVNLQGSTAFTVNGDGAAVFADGASSAVPTGATGTTNANAAIAALDAAVTTIGQVQGKIGAAQNQLQYAVNLAQSQISSFSAAESRIRDADIASEASNLTKAQVLQQSSLAALAQANSEPQGLVKLLQG